MMRLGKELATVANSDQRCNSGAGGYSTTNNGECDDKGPSKRVISCRKIQSVRVPQANRCGVAHGDEVRSRLGLTGNINRRSGSTAGRPRKSNAPGPTINP